MRQLKADPKAVADQPAGHRDFEFNLRHFDPSGKVGQAAVAFVASLGT
jgi:hypothetical protein